MKNKIEFDGFSDLATGLRMRAASDEKMKYKLLACAEQLEKIVQDGALVYAQLFDLNANPVDAVLTHTRNCWNPSGNPIWKVTLNDTATEWVHAFPGTSETLSAKGYAEGRIYRACSAVYDEKSARLQIIPLDIVDYEIDY